MSGERACSAVDLAGAVKVRVNFAGRVDAAGLLGAAETAERTEKRRVMVEDFIVYVCMCVRVWLIGVWCWIRMQTGEKEVFKPAIPPPRLVHWEAKACLSPAGQFPRNRVNIEPR